MSKQTNILTTDNTRAQIEDLATWWSLRWGDGPNTTAIVRRAIAEAWRAEMARQRDQAMTADYTRGRSKLFKI